MISIVGQTVIGKYVTYQYEGKSTDTKPVSAPNGSKFKEMDTGNEYFFDGDECEWLLKTQSNDSAVLVSIEFTSNPDIDVNPNDNKFYISYDSAVVEATYSNGDKRIVTNLCTFDPVDGSELTEGDSCTATYTEGGITKTAEPQAQQLPTETPIGGR